MPRTTRSTKKRHGGQGRRNPRTGDWAAIEVSTADFGPGVTAASLDEVLEALEGFDPASDWERIAEEVVPIFQRVRPYPPGFPEALRMMVPPGLSVSFAIDLGPAFTHITADSLERWGVSLREVAARAMVNLDRRAAAVDVGLVTEQVDGIPLRTLQSGSGSASTFLLVPHRLPAIFGAQPQYFIAPMRDLLISLPPDVDRAFAAWLMAEFAELDPNHLAPIGFRYRDETVTVEALGEALATA